MLWSVGEQTFLLPWFQLRRLNLGFFVALFYHGASGCIKLTRLV